MFYSKWKKISSQAKGRGKESLQFSFVLTALCLPTRAQPPTSQHEARPSARTRELGLPQVLWKLCRQVDTELQHCLRASASLPPDPWGRWPPVAERNTKMGLEVPEVLHSSRVLV